MNPQIETLLILQERDRRLRALTDEAARLPRDRERAKERLAGDTRAVDAAKQAVQANEVEIKKVELDAATRKTTIQRLKQQQFETRKNDEFQALGNEVVRYEAELDALETRELELMEHGDSLREALAAAEEALAKTRRLVDEDLAAIETRAGRLDEEIAEARTQRNAQAEKVPEDLLPLYDRLIKTKNGIAVVPAAGGQCGGCHMKLIASTMVKVQAATEIVRCENCGRILYAQD